MLYSMTAGQLMTELKLLPRIRRRDCVAICKDNATAGADNTKLLKVREACKTYLLDGSLEALGERGGSRQSAVIRRAADKKGLFEVKIYVQVLMRQDKNRHHKAVGEKNEIKQSKAATE